MPEVNLFGVSQFSRSANVSRQQRLNAYLEPQPGDDRAKVAIYGTPGKDLFLSTLGDTPVRGMYQKGDFLYLVHRGVFYEVNNAGVATNRGVIGTTSGRVYMADNGTQLMLTDGSAGYIYTFATANFAQIVDVDYPGASTVTWLDGYFIVNKPDSQRFYISGINDGTSWDALDFASAESNPDEIVAVIADNSTLHLFGPVSTEFWSNSGATDFPFSRISGGAIEWGLAAKNSLVKYDNNLAFLAKNRMGEVFVARLAGYTPQRISTPDIEFIINGYSAVSDATGISYMVGGHPMYQINFPSAGESWLYDGLSSVWSKLESYGETRDIAEIGTNYLDKIIVSDYSNGNLYRLNPETFTENGQPLAFEVISRHLSFDDKRFSVDMLQLDMETGVGATTGQGSNPQIMLQVSTDGGHTWGTEQWATFGALGNYKTRAIWRRVSGIARDVVFKFRITDPVKRVILGASIQIRQGRT
jgi:hypothetical protein